VAVERSVVTDYLDQRLQAVGWPDYGPNGLQVEGSKNIERLALGVSACDELFTQAVAWQAQGVLVHHGILWDAMPLALTGVQYGRVKTLIEGGLNLIAYHLPLDAHPEIGNNAVAARRFGLLDIEPFGEHNGRTIGFCGRFPEPITPQQLTDKSADIFGQQARSFLNGPNPVRSIGIISGGAQSEFHQAIAKGLDAYVTGEASEWVMNWARETGTHYLAAGHYATERLGIQALGNELESKFDLEVRFFDIPNPV